VCASIEYFKSFFSAFLELGNLSGFKLKMADIIEISLTKCNGGTIQSYPFGVNTAIELNIMTITTTTVVSSRVCFD
jgi:hypothetical protein